MAKVNQMLKWGYKYKPSTAAFFKPTDTALKTPEQKRAELEGSLTGQVRNLERRFGAVGQPTSGNVGTGVVDDRNVIEKALNLSKNQGFIMDILEVLDRPREVVANVLSSLGETDKRDVLTAAWEGLSGKQKLTTNEAVKNLTGVDLADKAEDFAIGLFGDSGKNVGLDDIAKFTVNVALDIAGDPLTYGFSRRIIMAPFKAFGKGVSRNVVKGLNVIDDFAKQAIKNSKSPLAKGAAENWKRAREFFNEMSYNLNGIKGLQKNAVAAERQILGETYSATGEILEKFRTSRQNFINALPKELKVRGGELVNDLVQSGADVVRKNGKWKIVFRTKGGQAPTRNLNIRDFLGRVKQNSKTMAFQDVGEVAEAAVAGGKAAGFNAKKGFNTVMLPNVSTKAQKQAFDDLSFLINGGRKKVGDVTVAFPGLNNVPGISPRAPGQKLFSVVTKNPVTGKSVGYQLSRKQKAYIELVEKKLKAGIPAAEYGRKYQKKYEKLLETQARANRSVNIVFNGDRKEIQTIVDFMEENYGDLMDSFAPYLGPIELSREVRGLVSRHGGATKEALDSIREMRESTRRVMQQNGEFFVWESVFDNGMEYMRRSPTEEASKFFKSQVKVLRTKKIRGGIDEFVSRKYDEQLLTSEINKNLKAIWGTKNDLFNPDAFDSLNDFIVTAQQKVTGARMTKLLLGISYDPNAAKIIDPNRIIGSTGAPTKYVKTSALGTRAKPGLAIGADIAKGKQVTTGFVEGTLFKSYDKNITVEALKEQIPKSFMILPKENFKDTFKKIHENLPVEMQKNFKQLLGAANAGGEVVAMHRSAYNMLSNIERAFVEVEGWKKIYDEALGLWKAFNLATPGFHARNLFGNATQMYLAGMRTDEIFRYSTKSWARRLEYRRLKDLVATKGKEVLTPENLKFLDDVDAFFRTGGSMSRKTIRDVEDVKRVVAELRRGKGKEGLGAFYEKVIDFNFTLAEDLDDWNRYATYLWGMDKYKDPVKAFNLVNETLFDYTHLTPFEKDIMKRVVPFYTFMKNNILFQFNNIGKNPQQYAKLLRSYKYFSEDIADIKPENMPEYMSGNMWLPIPTSVDSSDKETITFLKLNLPASDFFEFIENPLSKGVQSLTFPIKMAWEFGTNRDVFSGAPIKEFAGQKDAMLAGEGVLSGIRTERGDFSLTRDPVIIKLTNELGLRNPRKLVTAMLDVLDASAGKQIGKDLFTDLLERSGITTTKRLEDINVSALYQRLEYLRNLKKLYEQNTGKRLASIADLEKAAYLYKPK
jgi:hypothetical protein